MLGNHSSEKLLNHALQLLGRRKHTTFELVTKLKRKKSVSDHEIQHVVKRLHSLSLLDDLNFAEEWISYRTKRAPRGRRLLTFELMRKGVDGELIEQAFQNSSFSEEAAAKYALEKKFSRLPDTKSEKIKNKMITFLKSRGFTANVIVKNVQTYLA